jgi:hypothetical protein
LVHLKTDLAKVQSTTAPEYWPTAFKLITLTSQSMFARLANFEAKKNIVENSSGLNLIRSDAELRGNVSDSTFQDSIVKFDPNVRLKNVTFINCIFLFPVTQTPSEPLQKIGARLLAADLKEVKITAS